MGPLGFEGGRIGDLRKFHRPNVCLSSAAILPFFVCSANLARSRKNELKKTRMPVLRHPNKWKKGTTKIKFESEKMALPKNRRNQLHCMWKRPCLQSRAVFHKRGRRPSALPMLPLRNPIYQTLLGDEKDESRNQVSTMWQCTPLEKCPPPNAERRKKTALHMPRMRPSFTEK